MTTDIKLGDNEIVLESPNVTIFQGAEPPTSSALNFKNASGFWHISGPRTYEPGNSLSFYWNDNANWHGPSLALTTDGNVGIGTSAPQSSLHVHGGEIHSTGPVAGFSFTNRDIPDGKTTGDRRGERFVWYATGNSARLWANNDLLVIEEQIGAQAKLSIQGTIECTFIKVNGMQLEMEMRKLKTMVAELQAEVAALKAK